MESASADLSSFVNGSVWEVTGAPAFRSLLSRTFFSLTLQAGVRVAILFIVVKVKKSLKAVFRIRIHRISKFLGLR
jgi:hypothetical protein